MINIKKIKEISKSKKKKISKKAIKKILAILEQNAKDIIRKSARNADFMGRVTIKEDDIVNE